MNGAEVGVSPPELNPASRDCVTLLERYLAQARCGKLVFVGIVAVYGPEAVQSEFGGSAGLHMAGNLGCDVLKGSILPGSPRLVLPGR